MEHRENDDSFVILNKDDLVGKAPRESTACRLVHTGVLWRRALNGVENSIHAKEELRAEVRYAVFVPVERVRHLRFGFRADDEPTAHRLLLIRSRTIPHGEPSSGFR